MLNPGDSVLIGVSGGPDSLALLYILVELAPDLSLRLGVAHLNHGLRGPDSDDDAEFVSSISKKLNLACYTERADVRAYRDRHGLSLEEAARHVRYRFFSKTGDRNGYGKIAVGHHRDDNAELVLINMLRGSGPLGLSGIPPVRDDTIVRPLMGLSRSRIIDFLAENEIQYVSDVSNEDDRFIRNRIRHRLIPELKEKYNPKIVEILNRQSSVIRDEEEWIETIIQPIFDQVVTDTKDDSVSVSVKKINSLHVGARRRIIRKAIARVKGDIRRMTFLHIEATIRLAETGPKYGSIDLPGKIRIARAGDLMILSKGENAADRRRRPLAGIEPVPFAYTVTRPGIWFIKEIDSYFKFSETGREALSALRAFEGTVAFFDQDRVSFPLVVRNVRPGDRFRPLGMDGTQKVKKYFINNKVERTRRAKCPILLCGDRIIWLAGYRINESVKIVPGTRNVLKVELLLA
jgi:tRNA(Ile)-lysidine synthase